MRSKQKERGKSSSELALNKKIVAPQKLKILVLAGNDLLNQHLEFLAKCVNLIKVDVSNNHITRLPEKDAMACLAKLQVVFLHHNKLSSLQGLRPLYSCPNLVHLTYHHNPLQVHVKHDHQIVNSLSRLKLINNRVVFIEERANWLVHERVAVRADQSFLEGWKSAENSEAYYLKVLNLHLSYINNLWIFHNPIVIIQRAWRRLLFRNKLDDPRLEVPPFLKGEASKRSKRKEVATADDQHKIAMRAAFQDWKKWSEGLRKVRAALKRCKLSSPPQIALKETTIDKGYLSLPMQEYKRELRNMKVRLPVMALLKRIRGIIYQRKMAERLAACLRLKRVLFASEHSFYSITGIQDSGRIYYNRSQQHILDHFLTIVAQQCPDFRVKSLTCGSSKRYNAIRLVDPQTYTNRYCGGGLFSLNRLIWPSMKVVLCPRKKAPSHFKGALIGTKQLAYITNRDKVLSKSQREKSKEVYNRLEKFALNEYENSLWELECKEELAMRQLIRLIYYHNSQALKFERKDKKSEMLALMHNYDEPFMIYVDAVLRRTAAAVLIQKTWRRHVSNRSQPESIYHKINQNRAALHIQKFCRNYRYFHRQRFNKQLARQLSKLTPSLAYPLPLYLSLDLIDKLKPQNKLFKQLRVSRGSEGVGVSEEFYRAVFQKRVRDQFLGGRRIGTEIDENEVDLYNLMHYGVEVGILQSHLGAFVQLTYATSAQANLVACIIALLTYQPWGSRYLWPFTTAATSSWPRQLQQNRLIRTVAPLLPPCPPASITGPLSYTSYVVQPKGILICKEEKVMLSAAISKRGHIQVEFYQKRYHNFPLKHHQTLKYFDIQHNAREQKEGSPAGQLTANQLTYPQSAKQPTYPQSAKQPTYPQSAKQPTYPQSAKQPTYSQPPRAQQLGGEGAMSIRSIDKEQVHLFQQLQIRKKSEREELEHLNKTASVLQDKKRQVKRHYRQEQLRREAQKELKQANLTALRDKAKHEKMLNTTLRNLKEAERTHQLRSKVQHIKQATQTPQSSTQEQDFVQQNNFVMQQQLRMIMMRTQIKQAEQKKEEHIHKKTFINLHTQHFTPSLHSRHSEVRKPIEEEERLEDIGQGGSVVNARKRVRKSRAQSIGAYMRDPSFVHGVFPEEYYPIENRATTFYFPPLL